jgi:hypothetical protein
LHPQGLGQLLGLGTAWAMLISALQVFGVLDEIKVNVKMISQGASKTNISLIVPTESARMAVQSIHAMFFGVHDVCAASEAALNKAKPSQM